MRKAYQILRIIGYVTGLSGLAVYLYAGGVTEPDSAAARLAAVLLLVMFVTLFSSYLLYAWIKWPGRKK